MKIKGFDAPKSEYTIRDIPTGGILEYNQIICIKQEDAYELKNTLRSNCLTGLNNCYVCISLKTGKYIKIPSDSLVVYYPNATLDLQNAVTHLNDKTD